MIKEVEVNVKGGGGEGYL